MPHCCLVRAPSGYRYDTLNVSEESILTYLLGYFNAIGFHDYCVLDFHLTRDLTFADLLDAAASVYVIALRETVENPHYARRLATALADRGKRVIVYGQTGRLTTGAWGDRIQFVPHDERELALALGLDADGPEYGNGLTLVPYLSGTCISTGLTPRFKGVVETSRGCHFPCKFCFINAGDNYPLRWRTRPTADILADVRTYFDRQVDSLVFYDSEFLGADKRQYDRTRKLLLGLRDGFPGLRHKIYCRADTLLSFGEFDLLSCSAIFGQVILLNGVVV